MFSERLLATLLTHWAVAPNRVRKSFRAFDLNFFPKNRQKSNRNRPIDVSLRRLFRHGPAIFYFALETTRSIRLRRVWSWTRARPLPHVNFYNKFRSNRIIQSAVYICRGQIERVRKTPQTARSLLKTSAKLSTTASRRFPPFRSTFDSRPK